MIKKVWIIHNFMKYMGLGNVMLCLFQSKTLCKDNFLYFPVFGGIRINELKENYL